MGFFLGYWEIILEVSILWAIYYMIYLLLKGTGGEQLLKGIIIISVAIMLTSVLNLVIINWLMTRLLAISVIAFLIIFQPEIRRGLARIGRFGIFSSEKKALEEIAKAALVLSKRKVGALIAIERETGLRRYVESGVEIDAAVTSELINTIFTMNSPLHDGGIIVSNQRIEAAACLFPLTQNPRIPKTMGTRHRAALGLSEETDAVIVVVSEETGAVSLALGDKMTIDIDQKTIAKTLEKACMPKVARRSLPVAFKRILRNLKANNRDKE
ncbi:MAG: diadenylate cyclase CdaA [Candidatus Omnitrophota bacterium]